MLAMPSHWTRMQSVILPSVHGLLIQAQRDKLVEGQIG